MFTPRQLALGVLVAAALSTAGFAQQGAGTAPDKSAPSASSPSSTDGRTATQAQRNTAKDRSAKNDKELNRSERKFLEEAAEGGMAEVELGKLAASKASSDEVKKFAQKMADEHARSGDDLKSMASAKGVKWPSELDRKHKRLADNLNKASGDQFDKKYMSEMVRDHEKDLKDFQKQAKDAKDPQVKAFAQKGADMISEHLKEARQIAQNVGAIRAGRGANKNAARSSSDANTGASSSRMQKDQPATPGR